MGEDSGEPSNLEATTAQKRPMDPQKTPVDTRQAGSAGDSGMEAKQCSNPIGSAQRGGEVEARPWPHAWSKGEGALKR